MKARFRIFGRLDRSYPQEGTVSIDRETGILEIRPLRRRRVYRVHLSDVATMAVQKICRAEARERRRAKKKNRRKR